MLSEQFEIAGGSVTGADHSLIGKPNQDAYYTLAHPDLLVGIVSDGCGDPASPYSEVGARLISRATAAQIMLFSYGGEHVLFSAIQDKIVNFINNCALSMAHVPLNLELDMDLSDKLEKAKRKAITDHFLCTIVGFAITTVKAYFFSVGDGTIVVNGQEIKIGPFPNNAPPYIAYRLLDSSLISLNPSLLNFNIVHTCNTNELESFLIGSDGAQEIQKQAGELMPDGKSYSGPLDQFWMNDNYFSNSQSINRRLYLMNKAKQTIDWENRTVQHRKGLLHDDTTLVVGRRKTL